MIKTKQKLVKFLLNKNKKLGRINKSTLRQIRTGMLQNSTFVGLALPLFLIAFFGYLVWLQFFSLLKPVNYSFSRRFLECFRC